MNTFFVSVRVLHILIGAIWLGAAVLVSLFVMPSIREAGSDGAKVMAGLGRRKIHVFIASISGLTALTGLWLYWHFTDGLNPELMRTAGAHVFGTGGVLGLAAAIIAASVVAKNMRLALALLPQLEKADAAARAGLMDRLVKHRQKAATGGRIVAILLVITIVLMAVGHYV